MAFITIYQDEHGKLRCIMTAISKQRGCKKRFCKSRSRHHPFKGQAHWHEGDQWVVREWRMNEYELIANGYILWLYRKLEWACFNPSYLGFSLPDWMNAIWFAPPSIQPRKY